MSETLWLELPSFSVSIVTVMAGVIDSEFHTNDLNFNLFENSHYALIKDIIAL